MMYLNNVGDGAGQPNQITSICAIRPQNLKPTKTMSITKRNLIVTAAIAGLLTGVAVKSYGDDSATNSAGSSASSSDSSKHDCKGKNDCKGKGGCKTDANSCKGQNSCKGKGGCKS